MKEKIQDRRPRFSVFIPGKPTAWARARLSSRGGFFTPAAQRAYRMTIQRHVMRLGHEGFKKRPLEVFLDIYLPRAKSNKDEYPVGRNTCDADNWAKMFLDALNGVLFHDDSQIVNLTIRKRWAESPMNVGAHLEVNEYF